MIRATPLLIVFVGSWAAASSVKNVITDEALCREHTATHANQTWRLPNGVLKHPYLVPAGPYEQEWDWDSVFLGVATLPWGSRQYLEGSMMNFFAATNLSTGAVTGCLTPKLPTVCSSDPTEHSVLYHAKPLLIQGAWLSSVAAGGDPSAFAPFAPAMKALLDYWDRPPRVDLQTGLRVWHDQLESGADNCVLSQCPGVRSPECWSETQAFTLASPDLMVFLQREHASYALFCKAWAAVARRSGDAGIAKQFDADAESHSYKAAELHGILNERLWRADLGYHAAFNVSSRQYITNRTYQIAIPLWAGLVNASQAKSIAETIRAPDLLSKFGMRSASSADLRYSNADIIVPYSNWRGPMWVNANAMACYGLAKYGYKDLSLNIAERVLASLADDLRSTGEWHEAYSTDNGTALAAPGFMSWNTLSAELASNIHNGIDPLALQPHTSASGAHAPDDMIV